MGGKSRKSGGISKALIDKIKSGRGGKKCGGGNKGNKPSLLPTPPADDKKCE